MKRIITYGTYDLLHIGHLRLLTRARELGDELYVGVSSDEFNAIKGKRAFFSYADRAAIVAGLRCVDHVFPEHAWDQKPADFRQYGADMLVMGSDWEGRFDHFKDQIAVHYLPRTDGVSSTEIKNQLQKIDDAALESMRNAINLALGILNGIR